MRVTTRAQVRGVNSGRKASSTGRSEPGGDMVMRLVVVTGRREETSVPTSTAANRSGQGPTPTYKVELRGYPRINSCLARSYAIFASADAFGFPDFQAQAVWISRV